jgi:hypothetical protein
MYIFVYAMIENGTKCIYNWNNFYIKKRKDISSEIE